MTGARHKAHEALRRLDALARQGRKGGTFESGLRAARSVIGAVFEVDGDPDREPEPVEVRDRGRVVARVDDFRRDELRDELFAPFNRSRAVVARSAPYPDDDAKETA